MSNNVIESVLHTEQQGNNSNFLMILIIIIPIVLIVFYFIRKKRKQNGDTGVNNQSKEDTNEVWRTIKKFLRNKQERGKEVIDSYAIKRPEPHNLAQMTKEQKVEYKIEARRIKNLKTADPQQYKIEMERIKKEKRLKPKDLYVVLFTTKNAKTLVVDEPRAIECEVKMVKISKKESRREIEIVRELNYQEELRWIQPIKSKDDEAYAKKVEAERKKQQKALERRQSKVAK